MYSFYGGKLGRTYHIVKTYASIADMTADFAQGGQCTDVMYHEYVLIDTSSTSLNDLENGYLYRRGFDYNADGEDKPTFTAADYDGTELKETAKLALYKYIHNPGAGAIYVGCIRGSDGPGMALNNPTSTQHLATSVSNTNQITVTKEVDEKLGEHSTYSLTFDFPIPTFATPTVNTIVQEVDEDKTYNASVTIKPLDNAPFYLNSTFDILQGLKGDSITSVNYGGNAGDRRINFYATTQSRDEAGKITETLSLLGAVSYYGLEKLGVNSSNMHLMATYTQPSMNSDTQNPSTVEDLGELNYGIVSQNTVYRMAIGGTIYPDLPEFHLGDKPIVLQTLNTSVDSTNGKDVIGTFLLGYDTSTTHTSLFDNNNHTLSESHWYKMQEISGVTADPGKIITAGVMSSSTQYGDETVQYSNNIKPNIDLLAPGGFILNAYDTEIHEFGTSRDTHPTVEEFETATSAARLGLWTNGSPSTSEYYAERRRYVYYV